MSSSSPLSSALISRVLYDPTEVAVWGSGAARLFSPVSSHEKGGIKYVTVRLTARGNEGLREVCHTAEQKEVWRFPSYEFTVREGSIRVAQIQSARPSYVNALLIASRGIPQARTCGRNNGMVFADHVRLPGFWGGACAGCKWRDGAARCSYASPGEPKYSPAGLASLPHSIVEELED